MKTILGRDGDQWPAPDEETLCETLKQAAESDTKWTNYGSSSICLWAWNHIQKLEKQINDSTDRKLE